MSDPASFARRHGLSADAAAELAALLARGGGEAPEDRYRTVGMLGEGGMGEVRRVFDRVLGRVLAMKVTRAQVAGHPLALARFRHEARWAARLQHPGIVPVHDVGVLADGRLYFTMPEVRGRTFTDVIAEVHAANLGAWEPGPSGWTFRRLVEAFARVCETMAYAHGQGVVHRDLKPDNLMLGGHGEVLVLDWGLVKVLAAADDPDSDRRFDALLVEPDPEDGMATRMGSVNGTPAYMPPEQAMGLVHEVDARSDVYALGAVLYQLLCGTAPYADRRGESAVLDQVRAGPPTPLAAAPSDLETLDFFSDAPLERPEPAALDDARLPPALLAVCDRAMARAPELRFPSAGDLAREVRAWLDGARRREAALDQVAAAEARVPKTAALRTRAGALRQEAARVLGTVQAWQAEAHKAAGWALEDEATALERRADRLELEQRQDLHAALRIDGDLPEAHAALAERLRAEHAAAEADRDRDAMARTEVALRGHVAALPVGHPVRVQSASYLRGDGALTLVTDPPGAEVLLSRFEPRNRRLVPIFERALGRTPLVEVPLPMGSYLCELRHPDREPVAYPVCIGRGEHWHGVRPGDAAPFPIALPARGSLGADACYVPAGWFHSGGDPKAGHGLPKRRLWCDAFVVDRFPVTNAGYIVFLEDLVRQGRVEEALAAAPQERGGTQILAFDGARFTLVPDADGDIWEPEAPMLMVDYACALAYARWRAARQPGWRVLGSLEREKAGRGADGRFFPWGDAYDPSWVCNGRSHEHHPLPQVVDSFPTDVSVYGVRGLGGNVRDWCSELRTDEGAPVVDGRVVPPEPVVDPDMRPKARRVSRGGYWTSVPRNARCANRSADAPGNRLADIGIRLARSL